MSVERARGGVDVAKLKLSESFSQEYRNLLLRFHIWIRKSNQGVFKIRMSEISSLSNKRFANLNIDAKNEF